MGDLSAGEPGVRLGGGRVPQTHKHVLHHLFLGVDLRHLLHRFLPLDFGLGLVVNRHEDKLALVTLYAGLGDELAQSVLHVVLALQEGRQSLLFNPVYPLFLVEGLTKNTKGINNLE